MLELPESYTMAKQVKEHLQGKIISYVDPGVPGGTCRGQDLYSWSCHVEKGRGEDLQFTRI